MRLRENTLTLDIPTAPVFEPLLQPARYKGAYGGRGAAKSWFFAESLIEECIRRATRAVCVREVQRSLEQSVKRLLEDVIVRLKVGHLFAAKHAWIETPYDGIIIFQGMKDATAESLKSLEGYRIAWVEEAQSLSQRSLDLLRPTIREEGSEIWCSWNPRFVDDPVDDFFRGNKLRRPEEGRWQLPPDSLVVKADYTDNPWFPAVLKKEMAWDRSRDPEKYQHIWLGGYEKHSENRVFKNWIIEDFETPSDVTLLYGADWGYSVDPSVLVRCYVVGRKLFIDREAYRIGVEVDHLPALFDTVPGARQWPIVADSARPETISYLQRHGFPKMKAAVKGKDSVKEGVIFLQNYDIVVHPRCTHTIDELTHYSFKTNEQTNIVTPILEDRKNHVIDSLRYAVEPLRAVLRVLSAPSSVGDEVSYWEQMG